MMPIHKKIKEQIMPLAGGIKVEDVRIGLSYTAVQLENGQSGVAFTFKESLTKGCHIFKNLHPLAGRQAHELLALMGSVHKIEMAVGLATANALTNTIRGHHLEGDILDYLQISPKDKVGMVGYFSPMVPRLENKTSSILIFEQIKQRQGNLLPEEDALRFLPQCQVALITSTSIINHTVDKILDAARACREVVLLGASTPLIGEAFEETPVTFLSGVVVTNPREILRIISEGGGVRLFQENVRKVNMSLGS